MKSPIAVAMALMLACFLSASGLAQEAILGDLTVPQFDAAGKNMVRRLHAESAKGWPGKKSQLQKGTVEFFATEKDLPVQVASLDFADATYDPMSGIVAGDGHVVLHSSRGDLAGDGFQYDLARNHLRLKSNVTFDLNGSHVAGGEAEADLAQIQSKDAPVILRATVKKGAVVTPHPSAKQEFDKAKTESAVYAASDDTVVLSSPVETWRKGEKIITEAKSIRIQLGKSSPPPFAPAVKSGAPASSP